MKSALVLASALLATWPMQNAVSATTSISDLPYFVTNNVPPNMMLALSVEWPTGVVAAYQNGSKKYGAPDDTDATRKGVYDNEYVDNATTRYVGYFDPAFCYKYYQGNGVTVNNKPSAPLSGTPARTAAVAAGEYFKPVALATKSGTATHQCVDGDSFSGNFLNWATTHSLDAFRLAMTGGDRVIDTDSITVVEKTRHTGQGGYPQFPIKDGTTAKAYVSPFAGWSKLYIRLHNGNGANGRSGCSSYACTNGELNGFSDANTRGRMMEVSNNINFANGGSNYTYTYLVRVQVCDKDNANAALRFEYNSPGDFNTCQGYPVGSASPTVYKPIGLIQKNAEQIRFGASGYLADDSPDRSGGVLRARPKSVGPNLVVATGKQIANLAAEWDASTGVYVKNPDSAEATASAVENSGVINYLNRFGKITTGPYKSYDTLSELYYSILRVMRNMKPVTQYTKDVTPAMTDGFPVITTAVTEPTGPTFTPADLAPLPIQYYCQQTNIVGIADANVQCDIDVPGNKTLAACGAPHAKHPNGSTITDDSEINVQTLGNTLGGYEFDTSPLNTKLGETWLGSDNKTTYHVASLAYWANTKDMLGDDNKKPWTTGKQQAKTYFVDIRENGSKGPVNNQMWLAAKYGGFDDVKSDGKPSSLATWHTNSDPAYSGNVSTGTSKADVGLRPDNYFFGDSPDKLFKSLSNIFDSVKDRKLSGQGFTASTNNFRNAAANSGTYSVSFKTPEWTGDVKGYQISYTGTTPTTTLKWSAQEKLDAQISNGSKNDGWTTQRKIVTYDGSAGAPFQWASLNTTQKGYLQNAESMLQYLRGKNCDEVGNKTTAGCIDESDATKTKTIHRELYRARANVLGDIVDSEATVADVPSGKYFGASGYSAFVSKYKARKRMLYVGANDGMMHAIDGDVGSPLIPAVGSTPQVDAVEPGTTAGQELWAYVPNMVFAGPTLPTATPNIDGLAARTLATGFGHKYYVNQTPYVIDIDFEDTKGATKSCATTEPECSWRTILVGGLGKGGRGYYAIDVTNPADMTDEAEIAKKVLWEFTDEDMGFSFGKPVVVRTKRDGWVVILSSGYNNIYGTNKGKGFLYVLNAKSGELIQKIATDEGTEAAPSGFAHPAAFIPDYTTFFTDYVYGGDLNGNVWRFDLRGSPKSYPVPTKIATLTSGGGSPSDPTVAQPVTTEPRIEVGRNGVDRWVFIGTGQFLSPEDMESKAQQTFYAFRDGTLSSVYGTETGQRGLPSGVTFPVTRSSLVATTLEKKIVSDTEHPMGWYYDLAGTGERITQQIVANEGLIVWLGLMASTDACLPGAESRVYAAGYEDGLSRLVNSKGELIPYYSSSTFVTKAEFGMGSDGNLFLKGSYSNEKSDNIPGEFKPGSGAPVKVNWREIQQ